MQKELKFYLKGKKGENTYTAYASTLTVDRDEEIVMPDAYVDYKDVFMKNPVLLQFHDYWKEPVGKITDLTHDDYGMIMTIEFAPTEDGQKFKTLYEGGYMNAFSIGFIGQESVYPESKEFKDIDEKYGLSAKSNVWRIFTKIELLEVSCVPVPSNRDAVIIGAKSFLQANSVEEFDNLLNDLKELKLSIQGEDMENPEKTDVTIADELVDDTKEVESEEGVVLDDSEVEKSTDEDVDTDVDLKEIVSGLAQEIKDIVESAIESAIESAVSEIEDANEKMLDTLTNTVSKEVDALGKMLVAKQKKQNEKNAQADALSAIFDELKNFKNSEV